MGSLHVLLPQSIKTCLWDKLGTLNCLYTCLSTCEWLFVFQCGSVINMATWSGCNLSMLYDSRDRQVSAGGREHTIWMDGVNGKFFPSQIIFHFTSLSESSLWSHHPDSCLVNIKQRRWEDWRSYQNQSNVNWITKKSVLELQCASDDSDGVPVLHHLLQCLGGFSDNFVLIICIKIVTYCLCDALLLFLIIIFFTYWLRKTSVQQSPC